MNRSDIDDTVRDMWSTRPHRSRDDRKIAGVAAAIARRYRIDPILVRVAFVVTAISGGVGVMLYLLGWLLLPEEGDEVSGAEALIGQGHSSMSKALTIVLAIALIPASSGLLFTAHVSALFAVVAVAAAMFLLHKHRAGSPTAVSVTGTVPTAPTADTPDPLIAGSTDTPAAAAPQGQATPPEWDPLGVAPFAWDLPEPGAAPPPQPPERRRRSIVTPVTLALALVVAGAGAIAAMASGAIGPREVTAATLAVIGAGLVVGSFVRGGRGLIAVAIPLALATYAMTVVPFERFGPDGVGDRAWTVRSVGELQPEYRLGAGDATLDLRELKLSDTDTVHTAVRLGMGDLTVLLPPEADVEARCEAGLGNITCLDGHDEGSHAAQDKLDTGPDGPGGGKIVLTASVGTGDVEVSRG
jgi:phage shock protein PspC (stress-responsive transcriptional regulator)